MSENPWLVNGMLLLFLILYAYLLYNIAKHIERISDSASKMMDKVSEAAEPSILGSVISAIIGLT